MGLTEILQAVSVAAAAGTVLLMAITIRRWTASFESRVSRIDSLLDRIEERNR